MFTRKAVYTPPVDDKYRDKITCLRSKDTNLLIGREDGGVELHKDAYDYWHPAFSPEFDCLDSEDIKERAVAVEQGLTGDVSDVVFVANEKTIKVLRMHNNFATYDLINGRYSPEYKVVEEKVCHNVHSYVLNSLSLNNSGDSLLGSDFIRINLWKPERMDKFYNLVDIKPQLFGGVVFVINSAKFSPFQENLFVYSTQCGDIAIQDVDITPRSSCAALIKVSVAGPVKSVFDVSFASQNHIVARTLNTVSLFDIRNPDHPVFTRQLSSDPYELSLLNSSDAVYQTYHIAGNNLFAYTGSCFNIVYSVNILTGDLEEVLIGDKREFNVEHRIKYITLDGNGFACAYQGQLLRFSHDV